VKGKPTKISQISVWVKAMIVLILIVAGLDAMMNYDQIGLTRILGKVLVALIVLPFLFAMVHIIIGLTRSMGWAPKGHKYSSRNGWSRWDHDDESKVRKEDDARGEVAEEQYDEMNENLENED